MFVDTILASAAITVAVQLSGFAVAFALQTEKFYDVVGGLNYLCVVAISTLFQPVGQYWSDDRRKIAVTIVFLCSRAWLLGFLAWRAHERQGDARFDGVKERFGQFLLFWVVQGVWVMLISLPVLFVNAAGSPRIGTLPPVCVSDTIWLTGFAMGVLIEAVADIQKASWVRSGRAGGFCQHGLWKFSRHPNYFGEMLQWWCAWAFAYSVSTGVMDMGWWSSICSPLFTMHVLLNLPETGVAQANGKSLKRYYDRWPKTYAEYRQNTSILIPMIGYAYVPLLLKRSIFLDFERYEYQPHHPGHQKHRD